MSEREPARVLGTGIEFTLEDEHEALPEPPRVPLTPERRAANARVERGELIAVRAQEFVDFETADGTNRWHGASFGTAIDPGGDPALALLELVDEARLNGPFGDLRRCGFDVTRWEYYSAPHRLELSERLRARLGDRL